MTMRAVRPPAERFWEKVDQAGPVPPERPDLGPCWLWTGGTNNFGYGSMRRGRRTDGFVLAHVFAYELLVGPVPVGLELDHLCRVHACCNPAHVEPVTHAENIARGYSPTTLLHLAGRCARGHDAAVHAYRRKSTGDVAYCKECRREDRAA